MDWATLLLWNVTTTMRLSLDAAKVVVKDTSWYFPLCTKLRKPATCP